MLKLPYCPLLLILAVLVSCGSAPTEKEELSHWDQAFIDSSYKLLYKDSDTTRALHYFDSSFAHSGTDAVYPRAARYGLLANYYYFFTADNQSTASMIDSGLAVFNTSALQNRYPRTYVGLLLFGGKIAYRLNRYGKANNYYFRAKVLGDRHLSACERAPFCYNIAMVLYRQQNFEASLHYFKEAYSLQESCSPQTTAVALQQQEIQANIGLCFVELKKYDSALVRFDKAWQIADQNRDSLGPVFTDGIRGVLYGHRGKVRMLQGRLREAEQLSLKSIALNDRNGYEQDNAQKIKLQLADIYGRMGRNNLMSGVLRAIPDEFKSRNPDMQIEWKRLMAAYYANIHQPDSALHYLTAYYSLQDSLAAKQRSLRVADVSKQLEDREQSLRIATLEKENQVALTSLWILIPFCLMAVLIILLVYSNYRRSKKNVAVLRILNKEIQSQKLAREEEARQRQQLITEAVINAQENERSIIGLELHDNVNQVLTTVKLHNEMLLDGTMQPGAILPRTLDYIQQCINEIRSLSRRLSAPTLGKISVEESVKDLIDSINAAGKVNITHGISGFDNRVLPRDIHLALYRILQEQLSNIIKHAEASDVRIELERSEDFIHLLVTDNGKGFTRQNQREGIGLINMQTRAESLNGTFELQSKPGMGCKVRVVLPCFS